MNFGTPASESVFFPPLDTFRSFFLSFVFSSFKIIHQVFLFKFIHLVWFSVLHGFVVLYMSLILENFESLLLILLLDLFSVSLPPHPRIFCSFKFWSLLFNYFQVHQLFFCLSQVWVYWYASHRHSSSLLLCWSLAFPFLISYGFYSFSEN